MLDIFRSDLKESDLWITDKQSDTRRASEALDVT